MDGDIIARVCSWRELGTPEFGIKLCAQLPNQLQGAMGPSNGQLSQAKLTNCPAAEHAGRG